MIIPGRYPVGRYPCGGPGLLSARSSEAVLTGIVTLPPNPPPPEAIMTSIVTIRQQSEQASLGGIVQNVDTLAVRVQNAANQPASLGNVVRHEETTF